MENIITCTGSNFQSTIASDITVVDFWAPWCGPCQMMLPILAEFARTAAGKVTVAKVNVDEEPAIAQQYRIMGIPTLIIFKDGKQVGQLVGVQSQEKLQAAIDAYGK